MQAVTCYVMELEYIEGPLLTGLLAMITQTPNSDIQWHHVSVMGREVEWESNCLQTACFKHQIEVAGNNMLDYLNPFSSGQNFQGRWKGFQCDPSLPMLAILFSAVFFLFQWVRK